MFSQLTVYKFLFLGFLFRREYPTYVSSPEKTENVKNLKFSRHIPPEHLKISFFVQKKCYLRSSPDTFTAFFLIYFSPISFGMTLTTSFKLL